MKDAKVTDAEIEKFYKDNKTAWVKPEWRKVMHAILFKPGDIVERGEEAEEQSGLK